MKIFKNKLFFIIIATIISLFLSYNSPKCNAEVFYVCNVNTCGHDWYNPSSWFSDYYEITVTCYSEYVGGNWFFYTFYDCEGIGGNPCDFCENGMLVSQNDNIIDQDFLDISANLLKNHVISEVSDGNYNGYQAFNTIVNGYLVYRNLSWSSNPLTTEIELHINIYHE